jgi:hypothetical protein
MLILMLRMDGYPQRWDCSAPEEWHPLQLWYHDYHDEVNRWQPWYSPEFQGGSLDSWGPNSTGTLLQLICYLIGELKCDFRIREMCRLDELGVRECVLSASVGQQYEASKLLHVLWVSYRLAPQVFTHSLVISGTSWGAIPDP